MPDATEEIDRLINNVPWTTFDQSRGSCVGADVNVFFPSTADPAATVEAKGICSTCPIQVECREWGLENELFGIWGGLTKGERINIRMGRDPNHTYGKRNVR